LLAVSFDYPELPKEESSTTKEASDFSNPSSGHPLQLTDNVEGNGTISTYSKPGNLTSVETSPRSSHTPTGPTVPSVLPGNNSSHNIATSFSDRTVPQVGVLSSKSSATNIADVQVVPNANLTLVPSVNHNVVPNGVLPVTSAVMHQMNDTSMATPLQHPNMTLQHNQQENTGVYHQQDMTTPWLYPQHDMATPVSYLQQSSGSFPQQNLTTPVFYSPHDMMYSQQGMTTPGFQIISDPDQHFSTPGIRPLQDTTALLPSTQQDVPTVGSQPLPAPHPSQGGVPMYAPQQPQAIPQGTQGIPPGTKPAYQDQPAVWTHNPRVAHGPLPTPPTYEDASLLPSHPPVQPPLPPPISVPLPENGSHNTGPVAHGPVPNTGHIPQSDPNNMAAQVPTQPVYHQQQNVPPLNNVGQSLQCIEPVPISQPAHGPASVQPPIVQPVNQVQPHYTPHNNRNNQSCGLQTVVLQRDDKKRKAERDAAIERERQDALARERQAALEMERQAVLQRERQEKERQAALEMERQVAVQRERQEKERQAALEREKQERILLEKEKEDLRRRHEELEMIMSRNTATEQQVMELRDQLQAREKSLAAKEFEQQAMMQERQRLQEQKEKEITDLEQKLLAEKFALQQQRELQQNELMRERQTIEQHKIAALKEVEKERETILLQQKQLRERQQNMEEQMAQWLQTRNQNNNRQVQVETGLPVGWEKKFDQTTGRFYYQDHNTKTTHWNPPSSWLTNGNPAHSSLRQGVTNQQVTPNVPQPSAVTPGNVPKSTSGHSQPLAAKIKPPSSQTSTDHNPSVGPSAKPVADNGTVAVPDRSTKPQSQPIQPNRVSSEIAPVKQISPLEWKRKMENLQPVHGGSMVGIFEICNAANAFL